MPYMHPNLAQITQTHIALTILTGRIIIPSATDSYISVPGVATRMWSNPASLINWHTIDGDGMHIPPRGVGNFTSLDYPPTPTPLQACSPLTPSSSSNTTAQSKTLSAILHAAPFPQRVKRRKGRSGNTRPPTPRTLHHFLPTANKLLPLGQLRITSFFRPKHSTQNTTAIGPQASQNITHYTKTMKPSNPQILTPLSFVHSQSHVKTLLRDTA